MVVTLGQQYNIGEKPTVILYTYINRLAGTPEKSSIPIIFVLFVFRFVVLDVTESGVHGASSLGG